jgi:hypothetical protein
MPVKTAFDGILREASEAASKEASSPFACRIFGNEWDQFVEAWASKAYTFVAQALGPYQKEPLREIQAMSDGAHVGGANASFQPSTGQIQLSRVIEKQPGITLEKLTHELCHASLASFPDDDGFYTEGFVDYSVWVMAHAPFWEPYRKDMIDAAAYNIKCRRDRALQDLSDWDRKRWAGGLFASTAHGPWIVAKLKMRKLEGDFRW